jgi:hypothetical protein
VVAAKKKRKKKRARKTSGGIGTQRIEPVGILLRALT